MTTKTFHIGDMLSITDGKLVSPEGMGGVYKIIDHVTGETHLTHQLIRAAGVVKPVLLEQHPWLAEVPVPEDLANDETYRTWMAETVARFGEYHEVEQMPLGAYVGRDPIAELREMAPHATILAVEIPPDQP